METMLNNIRSDNFKFFTPDTSPSEKELVDPEQEFDDPVKELNDLGQELANSVQTLIKLADEQAKTLDNITKTIEDCNTNAKNLTITVPTFDKIVSEHGKSIDELAKNHVEHHIKIQEFAKSVAHIIEQNIEETRVLQDKHNKFLPVHTDAMDSGQSKWNRHRNSSCSLILMNYSRRQGNGCYRDYSEHTMKTVHHRLVQEELHKHYHKMSRSNFRRNSHL